MPQITGLGHLGIFCDDLENMREFYSQFMGLTITDEDLDRGICFMSADPKSEHHELALARPRGDARATKDVQQISFIVKSMDDLKEFNRRIKARGLRIDRTVTHGISCSIYFFDPEDNRVELYYKTGYNVKQRFGEPIDLEDPTEKLLEFSKSFEATLGPPQGATR